VTPDAGLLASVLINTLDSELRRFLAEAPFTMDERNFKKHLAALAKGKHDVTEHDWSGEQPKAPQKSKKRAGKRVAKKAA
jgi:hypothetical protein